MGGGRPRSLRMLFGRAALLFSVGFLVAVLFSGGAAAAAAATAEGRLRQLPGMFTGRSTAARMDLDLAYVSKRRVPNGADPIHNRRAGKSVRPPGRV